MFHKIFMYSGKESYSILTKNCLNWKFFNFCLYLYRTSGKLEYIQEVIKTNKKKRRQNILIGY